ncbi:MAG: hypothetical protein SOX77_04840 [Candidatus Borkfalkiaceae bacterium]|nr:hypothetical protein [Christensenellaceae bacterium]
MTDKIDDSAAYNAELEKLRKRYKEKLKGVLEDAREKYRFTISELILKELFESASRKKSNTNPLESDNSQTGGKNERGEKLNDKPVEIEISAEPTKAEIMKKTQEAVKAFAKTALTKILIEYVKDVQTLNSAFCKANSGAKFSESLDFDSLTNGLNQNDDFLSSPYAGENADCLAYEKIGEMNESDNDDENSAEPCGIFCPNNSKEIN